jgi:deoxyribonuclease (pyrimidine dimer)
MTRINAAIKPAELCNSMLFAEYREIKRVPNKVKQGKYNFNNKIPETFTLGTGHESFFRDKLLYLKKRSDALYIECLKRGINCQDYSEAYEDLPTHLFNDWVETPNARPLLVERINLRLSSTNQVIRYYDKVITKEQAFIKL